jgi:hypothetical protein
VVEGEGGGEGERSVLIPILVDGWDEIVESWGWEAEALKWDDKLERDVDDERKAALEVVFGSDDMGEGERSIFIRVGRIEPGSDESRAGDKPGSIFKHIGVGLGLGVADPEDRIMSSISCPSWELKLGNLDESWCTARALGCEGPFKRACEVESKFDEPG